MKVTEPSVDGLGSEEGHVGPVLLEVGEDDLDEVVVALVVHVAHTLELCEGGNEKDGEDEDGGAGE